MCQYLYLLSKRYNISLHVFQSFITFCIVITKLYIMKARTMAFMYIQLLIALAINSTFVYSQAPQGFSYQAIIRDSNGTPIKDQVIGLKITLQDDLETYLYTETHTPKTNGQGIISVTVGGGNQVGTKTFSSIPWSSGKVFIKVEVDPTGGTGYTALGIPTKLQSVPFAIYASNGPQGPAGVSINWLGTLPTEPSSPTLNQAYYNSSDKKSYIWNGTAWNLLAQDGSPGAQGLTGAPGAPGTGLTNKGAWLSGTSYANGDYVFDRSTSSSSVNSMWICQLAVSSTTPPYQDNTHWVEFQAPAGPQGPAGPLVSGTAGQTLRNNGSAWEASSVLINNGTNLGIGVNPTQTLDVNGTIRLRGSLFDGSTIPNSGTANQILTSTGAGVQWQSSSATGLASGTGTAGQVALWNGNNTLQGLTNLTWASSLQVASNTDQTAQDPIFEVKNKLGQVVFGVYQNGVRIYVNEEPATKGGKGGFAVGGLSGQSKADPVDYLRIYPDSARIYVNNTVTKGGKGGFAVGGLSGQSKGLTQNLMYIGLDSARIYIDETSTKGSKGGFAVGGLSGQSKGGGTYDLLKVTTDSTRIYINDSITTKGGKGGFAVGGLSNQSKGKKSEFMRISRDSSRIYFNSDATTGNGGFAVGGLPDQTSGVTNRYLYVHRDSTRIYINDDNTKGANGGFAVGGLTNQSIGEESNFFNVSTNASKNIYPSEKRVLWYPLKNAFLAGQVIIEKPDSVGINSFATGYESKSKGNYSQAFGYQSIARGQYSTAIGYQAVAHKNNSFAFGYQAKATNFDSYAFGSGAVASGNKSFAFGSVGIDSTGAITGNTKAIGDYAYAFGLGSVASGLASLAFGANNTASGSFATAIGYKTTSGNWYSTAMGGYTTASGFYTVAMGFKSTASGIASCAFGNQSIASGVYSFACGDGAKAVGARSIALGAFSNAQGAYSFAVGYSSTTGASATAATALGRETNASATYSTAIGYQSASSGIYSLAGGNVSTASGISSIALGDHANASANYSIALGRNVTASTQYAIAIGNTTTASGDNSTAFGNQTTAVGKYSLAVGYGCTANAYASTAVGAYNVVEGTPGSWVPTEPIFVVGNGTSSTSTSNSVTVYKDGTMKLKSNFYPELAGATLGTSSYKWNTVFATNGTINTSDARLKDNIVDIAYGISDILKLKPISFFWKKNPEQGRKLGFIAQDVKPIISEVVDVGDDADKTLGINYTSFIPIIVKGMQDQQSIIEKQQSQIDELLKANKLLLERLEKLENKK